MCIVHTDTYICNALNIYDHNSHGKFIDIKTEYAIAFIALYGFITALTSSMSVQHMQVKPVCVHERTFGEHFKLAKFSNSTLTGTEQCVCMNTLIDLCWTGIGGQSQIF